MPSSSENRSILQTSKSIERLTILYGNDPLIIKSQQDRYQHLLNTFSTKFSDGEIQLFSTPGRTEIGGNHTDHNHGRVLAASVNLDSIAAASKSDDDTVTVHSQGYDDPFCVQLDDLTPRKEEQETTTALIRGMAARLKELGYRIGGINACIQSNVLVGSGLSSSASIEVLIGTLFNTLFNEGTISAEDIAQIGQYAENTYFNKPCGLMDQMTCAVGGIITIDFKNPSDPMVRKVNFDFSTQDYKLLVVDTGGNHADLTEDYASVPREMKAVAQELGAGVLRDIPADQLMPQIPWLREKVGDRALLRTLHFFHDNQRVLEQVESLEQGDFNRFLSLVQDSGNSSFKWLQNCYTTKNPVEQGLSLALALTEDYIHKHGEGACRVHGGGFAGTIQVFLPAGKLESYIRMIEEIFGKGSVLVLTIRPIGSIHINPFLET